MERSLPDVVPTPHVADFTEVDDPLSLFAKWFEEAKLSEPNDPDAMALATTDPETGPDVRMVLLKSADENGFVFYTNTKSRKGRQLELVPAAALCLHWKSLRRQVRIRGAVERVPDNEADDYFNSRSRHSRVSACVSEQSHPLPSRDHLDARFRQMLKRLEAEEPVRPDCWHGYRVVPGELEFWHDGPFRLHDRVLFTREGEGWSRQRLYP